MGCRSNANPSLKPSHHHPVLWQTPISMARAAVETAAPFGRRQDRWTDKQGELSSLCWLSQTADSSAGAAKPWSTNNVASERVPKPPGLAKHRSMRWSPAGDRSHISVFSQSFEEDSGAWLSFWADASCRLGGSSSALRLCHLAPRLLILRAPSS